MIAMEHNLIPNCLPFIGHKMSWFYQEYGKDTMRNMGYYFIWHCCGFLIAISRPINLKHAQQPYTEASGLLTISHHLWALFCGHHILSSVGLFVVSHWSCCVSIEEVCRLCLVLTAAGRLQVAVIVLLIIIEAGHNLITFYWYCWVHSRHKQQQQDMLLRQYGNNNNNNNKNGSLIQQ